jgi:hypothetical protein
MNEHHTAIDSNRLTGIYPTQPDMNAALHLQEIHNPTGDYSRSLSQRQMPMSNPSNMMPPLPAQPLGANMQTMNSLSVGPSTFVSNL